MQGKLQSFLPYLDHLQQQNKIRSELRQRRETVLNDTINMGRNSGWTDEDVQTFTRQSEGLSEAAIPTFYNNFQTDTAAKTSLAGSGINMEGMNPLKMRMISEVYNNLSQYGPEVLAMYAEKVNAGADPRAAMAEILPQAQAGMVSKTESAQIVREATAQRRLLEEQGVPAEKLAVYDELLPYMTASTLPMLSKIVTEDPAAAGRNAITSYRNLMQSMGMGAEALAEYDQAAAGVTPDLLPKLMAGIAEKYQTISDARVRGLSTEGNTQDLKSRIEKFDSQRSGGGGGGGETTAQRRARERQEQQYLEAAKVETVDGRSYVYFQNASGQMGKYPVHKNGQGIIVWTDTGEAVDLNAVLDYQSVSDREMVRPGRKSSRGIRSRRQPNNQNNTGWVWE